MNESHRPSLTALVSTALLHLPLALLLIALPAGAARADTFVVSFTATLTNVFGDLVGPLSVGQTVTGTIELDDGVPGVFTPSTNTTFFRSEMLYTGAVTSVALDFAGFPLTGASGDAELFDSGGPLAGDDSYEVTTTIDAGTIGAAVPQTFFFNAAYDDPAFVLADLDPLFPPPTIDPLSANRISLTSAGGGSAFGNLDDFSVISAPTVPVAGPLGWMIMTVALAGTGSLLSRRSTRNR